MIRYGQVECVKRNIILDIFKIAKSMRPNNKKLAQRPVPSVPQEVIPAGMKQKLFSLNQCLVGIMHTLVLNLGKHMLMTAVSIIDGEWNKFY